MLSVWDGDADELFRMIEHADLEEHSRWALFDVLTHLTRIMHQGVAPAG